MKRRHVTKRCTRGDGRTGAMIRAASTFAAAAVLLAGGCAPEKFDRTRLDTGSGGAGGTGGEVDVEADAGAPEAPSDASDDDASDDGAPPAVIHFDFESAGVLQGWQPVGGQRPFDVLDRVTQSTEDHHHGTGALAMSFDGMYTPLVGGTDTYYGVYTPVGAPPANAQVTLWLKATGGGATAMIYAQLQPTYLFQNITSMQLPLDVWTPVVFQMPATDAFYFGCLISGPLAFSGTIYLDDISW